MSEKSEYELLREKNLREQAALFGSMFKEVEEFNEVFIKEFEPIEEVKPKKVAKRTPRRQSEITEIRKSNRKRCKTPEYTFDDINEIHETVSFVKKVTKIGDIFSEFSFKRKPELKVPSYKLQSNIPLNENDLLSDILPVRAPSEINAAELSKIADKIGDKVISQNGTFCHQCKLKSLDTKTVCRSGSCVGVRGQFCGPCLKTRYRETVAIALKDPNWKCPPCRQICNCMTCRNFNQNIPTKDKSKEDQNQDLVAKNNEAKSVFDEYQISFENYKNLRKGNNYTEILEDENLIGFDKKLSPKNKRLRQSKLTNVFSRMQKAS